MGVAMSIPFAIDATGAVAQTGDETQQLLDRVQALVATLPGERVMRATYGVPTSAVLFMADDTMADLTLRTMISDAVARWEPSAVVAAFTSRISESLGLVLIDVQVSRADMPGAERTNTRTVVVNVGGTVSSTPS